MTTLPSWPEEDPPLTIELTGDAKTTAVDLVDRLRDAKTPTDVVLIGLGILRQANGRTIQFLDSTSGRSTSIPSPWR
jgi:hypothetical protein